MQYGPSFTASVSAPVGGILSHRRETDSNGRPSAKIPARSEKSPGATDDCAIVHHDVERHAGRRRAACQTGGQMVPIGVPSLVRISNVESRRLSARCRLSPGRRRERPEKNPPLVFKKCALGRLAIDGHDVRQDHGVSKVPWRVAVVMP